MSILLRNVQYQKTETTIASSFCAGGPRINLECVSENESFMIAFEKILLVSRISAVIYYPPTGGSETQIPLPEMHTIKCLRSLGKTIEAVKYLCLL